MARLNTTFLGNRPRPTPRILQFGSGNFLRGFLDWKIDRMNERGETDWGVVIVNRSKATDGRPDLNGQDGLYTVLSRGIGPDGSQRSDHRIVACVRREIPAQDAWGDVLELARDPHIVMVTSNTTEAGIVYRPCSFDREIPPDSFPAKITRLLFERWTYFVGQDRYGWQFLPCELIDRNGDLLRDIVLQHCEDWGLPPAFWSWLQNANSFYNTLVDRIVPGFPRDEAESLERELGYRDPFLTTAEHFHSLIVERRPDQPELCIPLAEWDDGTTIVADVSPYKTRKVAILNGAHTALCPLAILSGVTTVREAATTELGRKFLHRLLSDEVVPFLPLAADALEAFASTVLERFGNPYIRHLWYDISLNGLAKFRARNLDRLDGYRQRHGRPAPLTTLSLAAWLIFYLGRFPNASGLKPRDDAAILARMAAIGSLDDGSSSGLTAMVSAFLAETTFWGRTIDSPDLREAVIADVTMLTQTELTFERLADVIAAIE